MRCMDYFHYRDGALWCEELPVADIVEQVGTPAFVYSKRTLADHFERLRDAFAEIEPALCYSVKSCSNLHICRLMAGWGAWFDVVSGGELQRVLEAGGDPKKVVFAGVGKTDAEINAALDAGIAWFNAESEQELEVLAELAGRRNRQAKVALRVNPDVDPHTHVYTTTGKRETKFGVDIERARAAFQRCGGDDRIDLAAIHLHLGSPVNSPEPYVQAIKKTRDLIEELRRAGHAIRALNIGGGFGAHYESSEAPPAAEYARHIVPLLADMDVQVLLEPGRSVTANAGVLVARTVFVKHSGDRHFLIVDGAMTELLRPSLYGAYHFAWPVKPANGLVPPTRSASHTLDGCQLVDIVGGVCESGDFLAKERRLPPVVRGDLICLFSAGAYGMSMSSQYNSRPRACEVLVDGDAISIIRRRETYDDLVAAERC